MEEPLHPAMRALQAVGNPPDWQVVVRWSDGDEAVVVTDTFFDSDDNDADYQCWVVNVVKPLARAPRSERRLVAGAPWEIRSTDPIMEIRSLDGTRRWTP